MAAIESVDGDIGKNTVRMTAQEARDMLGMKKDSFLRTLGIIRQMCDSSIKEACRRGRDCLKFDVPPTIFAREYYDPRAMGRELAKQLYEDGFDVQGTVLHFTISWSTDDGGSDHEGEQHSPYPRRTLGGPMPIPFTRDFSRSLKESSSDGCAAKRNKKVELQLGKR